MEKIIACHDTFAIVACAIYTIWCTHNTTITTNELQMCFHSYFDDFILRDCAIIICTALHVLITDGSDCAQATRALEKYACSARCCPAVKEWVFIDTYDVAHAQQTSLHAVCCAAIYTLRDAVPQKRGFSNVLTRVLTKSGSICVCAAVVGVLLGAMHIEANLPVDEVRDMLDARTGVREQRPPSFIVSTWVTFLYNFRNRQ